MSIIKDFEFIGDVSQKATILICGDQGCGKTITAMRFYQNIDNGFKNIYINQSKIGEIVTRNGNMGELKIPPRTNLILDIGELSKKLNNNALETFINCTEGILVITLPTTKNGHIWAGKGNHKSSRLHIFDVIMCNVWLGPNNLNTFIQKNRFNGDYGTYHDITNFTEELLEELSGKKLEEYLIDQSSIGKSQIQSKTEKLPDGRIALIAKFLFIGDDSFTQIMELAKNNQADLIKIRQNEWITNEQIN